VADITAGFYGANTNHRKHKEGKFYHDIRILVETMYSEEVYVPHPGKEDRHVWAPANDGEEELKTAIVDVVSRGMSNWVGGKVQEYLDNTTYDPAEGFPLSGVAGYSGENMNIDLEGNDLEIINGDY
jgi:hypothetical protein